MPSPTAEARREWRPPDPPDSPARAAPEGHAAIHPRPKYRPQRLKAPANGRSQFLAATTGVCTAFAVGGLFAGLAGTFLAGPLHQPSPALTGLTIFLTFGAGVLVQTTATSWPARRLIAAGIVPMIADLCLLVVSAWVTRSLDHASRGELH